MPNNQCPIPFRRHSAFGLWSLILLLAALAWPTRASAVTNLKRGEPAPPTTLPDLDGKTVSTQASRGNVLIVVFGELHHGKTRLACEQIGAILKDPRLSDQHIVWMLIVSQDAPPADLKAEAAKGPWPAVILLDKDRRAFGAYQVAVLPSVVVIDSQGNVVYAVAGLIERFNDVLTDALLLAVGKLNAEQFDRTLHPLATTAPDEESARAERIANMADQLARRGGMEELAAEKYAEALTLRPNNVTARLGLGELRLRQRNLADAEKQFRAVLELQPESPQAAIGLAFVQLSRGGPELGEAEKTARKVLARNPFDPRAHFLMGLIFEQRHQSEEAAASFRKAAELLLERSEGR